MSAINALTVTVRRGRRPGVRRRGSAIGRAALITADLADVMTRLNRDDIPGLAAAAIHLREAARSVNRHVWATEHATYPNRRTVRGIGPRLRELR